MDMPPLSFGIQLQFICILDYHRFPGEYKTYRDEAAQFLSQHLRDSGILTAEWDPVGGNAAARPVPEDCWKVRRGPSSLKGYEVPLVPAGWLVQHVELVSRRFFFDLDPWEKEITDVLQLLQQLEGIFYFMTNETTGFHVHVGSGASVPLPLRVAKNVFQLTSAFERLLDQMHSLSRISVPEQFRTSSVLPLSYFHNFNAWNYMGKPLSFFERLSQIERVSNFELLDACFNFVNTGWATFWRWTKGCDSTVNFDNLYPDPGQGRPAETLSHMIEFRQHVGTLARMSIVHWITVTCKLVETGRCASAQEMMTLCVRAAHPQFRLDDLLRYLGCKPDLRYRYEGCHGAQRAVLAFHQQVPSRAPPLPDGSPHPILRLLNKNGIKNRQDAKPELIDEIVGDKINLGLYGLNPNASLDVAYDHIDLFVQQVLQQESDATLGLLDAATEPGASDVRDRVWQRIPYDFHNNSSGLADWCLNP